MTPEEQAQEDQDMADAAAAAAKAAQGGGGGGGFWSSIASGAADLGEAALGHAGALAHGAGAGVMGMLDLPAAVGTGIGNIKHRLYNEPLVVAPSPASNFYQKYVPPVKGYEESPAEDVGAFLGPMLLTGGAGEIGAAYQAAPTIARGLARALARTGRVGTRAAVTTGGAKLGSEAGRELGDLIDQQTGGTAGKDYLDPFFSILAGGAAAPTAAHIGRGTLSRALTNRGTGPASSATKLDAAERLGVPPSTGLVGNAAASYIEDLMAAIPFAGGPSYRARAAQHGAMGEAGRETAELMRGVHRPPGPYQPRVGAISKGGLGEQGIGVAGRAADRIQERIDTEYNGPQGLHGQIDPATGQPRLPRGTIVSLVNERAGRASMLDDPLTDLAQEGPTIRHFDKMGRKNSRFPVDQALDQQLRAQRAQAAQPLPQGHTPADAAAQQAALQQIDAAIWDNTGYSFQVARKQRGYGNRTDKDIALHVPTRRALREGQLATMRDAAVRAGIPADVFKRIEDRVSELITQRETIEDIAPDRFGKKIKYGDAHTKLFGSGGEANIEMFRTLAQNAPEELAQLLANQYEVKIRGKVAAGSTEISPETLKPKEATAWWSQQNDPFMRSIYGETPEIAQRQADLDTVLRADINRPTRTLPGQGRNTLGGPGIAAGTAGAAGVGLGLGSLKAILAATGFPAAMRMLGGWMTNPEVTRNLVRPPALWDVIRSQPNLSRILSSAVASGVPYSGAAMTVKQMNDKLREMGYTDDDLAGMSIGQKNQAITGAP